MPVFELARRPPQWLRVALAALLLGFALNSIAHTAHQHDPAAPSAVHGLACGYCASFGGVADAPRHTYATPVQSVHVALLEPCNAAIPCAEPRTAALPRAPPVS